MRILHVTQYCHAGSIGGTERYVLDLIRGLASADFQNGIIWLQPEHATEALETHGVRIFKLPTPQMRVDAPLPEFQAAAARLLEAEQPDWLHFHTFGLTEAALAKLAKQRGIPYAFTYHSPAWTCRRETMLLYGQQPCDGEVRAWRCSACQSQERLAMVPIAGHAATALSAVLGWAALPLGRTSLRRRAAFHYDAARFRRGIRSFLLNCDLVVSCCDWSTPVLRRNGARIESIFHCPQGVPHAVAEVLNSKSEIGYRRSEIRNEFVIGYVGRVTKVKGVHILMEGFSRMGGAEARLRIVGWEPERANEPYAQQLQKLAVADSRIELVPKKSFSDTLAEYRRLTLLAIPSTGMETGPLTMLEALALGVPVYGSNRIGQLNLLRDQGRLVDPNTPAGWLVALTNAYAEWKRGKTNLGLSVGNCNLAASSLRTMADVAAEMATRYQTILPN